MGKFGQQDKGVLRLEKDRDNKALVFMLERIKGRTLAQIAADYNCHPNTVANYVKRARERDLILDQAKVLIADRLLPLTLAVYEAHLADNDIEAARDILFGMGVLHKNSTIKHESSDEDTLDNFRKQYFEAKANLAIDVVAAKAAPKNVTPERAAPTNHARQQLPPGRLSDSLDQSGEGSDDE